MDWMSPPQAQKQMNGWIGLDDLDWTRWIRSDKLGWIREPAAGAAKNECMDWVGWIGWDKMGWSR
eukprot:7233797-Pyramimonas_sp.AAC.2